ncbi:MAG: hypothetical protein JWQ63_1322 [Mucilaginibacter sp.]|nr:hypothetical protein [Mucilaginibacter sp.]
MQLPTFCSAGASDYLIYILTLIKKTEFLTVLYYLTIWINTFQPLFYPILEQDHQ